MKWTEEDTEQAGEIQLDAVYPIEVVSAEERVSQKGNPMINLQLRVFVGEQERTMYDILMPQMFPKLRSFCETMGLIDKLKSQSLEATDCLMCEGFIRTAKKLSDKGYPQVYCYLAEDPTNKSKAPPKAAAANVTQQRDDAAEFDDPDIPF